MPEVVPEIEDKPEPMTYDELNDFVDDLMQELSYLKPAYDLLATSHVSAMHSLARAYAQIDGLQSELAFRTRTNAH